MPPQQTHYNEKRACAYLALLGFLLFLGLQGPSAAPLLQSFLHLWRQAAGERLILLQALDQTQASIDAGQVVPTWRQKKKTKKTGGGRKEKYLVCIASKTMTLTISYNRTISGNKL